MRIATHDHHDHKPGPSAGEADPAALTPEARVAAVATLLAAGLLRLHGRAALTAAVASGGGAAADIRADLSPDSSADRLEVCAA